jgi:reactive intermediate/imine deaminase
MNSKQSETRLPFAEAVKAGPLLYISGQIGVDGIDVSSAGASGHSGMPHQRPFDSEATVVMQNVGAVLQRNGLSYRDLVSVTIYLTDMADYAMTNDVYSRFFTETFPARVCIAVKELPMKARIEISAVAVLSTL